MLFVSREYFYTNTFLNPIASIRKTIQPQMCKIFFSTSLVNFSLIHCISNGGVFRLWVFLLTSRLLHLLSVIQVEFPSTIFSLQPQHTWQHVPTITRMIKTIIREIITRTVLKMVEYLERSGSKLSSSILVSGFLQIIQQLHTIMKLGHDY